MSGFQHDIAGGQGNLIIEVFRSPNYVPGVSGWAVFIDGSAEFNNLVIRGTFNGTDFIIGASGAFFYTGTPAHGNFPVAYIAASGVTTDPFANALPSSAGGITSFNHGAGLFAALLGGSLQFGNSASQLPAPSNITETGGGSFGASLTIESGQGSSATVSGNLFLQDDQSAGTPGTGRVSVVNAAFKSTGGSAASPTLITTDTEQALGSAGITNTTQNAARFALMPTGVAGKAQVRIDIAITVNAGGAAAGAYAFANTLPAGPPTYQFPGNYSRSYAVGFNGTITTATNNADLIIDGSGTGTPGRVRLQIPALPVNTVISCTCFIPLD